MELRYCKKLLRYDGAAGYNEELVVMWISTRHAMKMKTRQSSTDGICRREGAEGDLEKS
jgi:hypothetical protein